jgi:pimeloyl-ACP methyl ester carboxylesterase
VTQAASTPQKGSFMPVVQANGLDIHYRIDGAGPETLVLINGVGDDLEGWGFQRGDFAAAGLRVVTFDNRGSGTSSHPAGPYTSQQMAADTKGLVDALGLAPLHLCGVSMGGVIAQEYAIAHPHDLLSVVLANTYAAADPLTYAAFESWALVAETAGMPMMMLQQAPWVFSTDFYAHQPGRLAEFLGEMERTTQPASSFVAQIAALTGHDAAGQLGSITTPALVIASADDIIIKAALSRSLHDGLPQATWALLPGGHATFLEDPGVWNAAVLDFIGQHRVQPRTSGGDGTPERRDSAQSDPGQSGRGQQDTAQ